MTKYYHLDEELQTALEDLESVVSENEELKENIRQTNEFVMKM